MPPTGSTPANKLRVVVYGQEGLTNTYAIDAGGSITMPLIGSVPARGRTPAGLAAEISGRLRNGYIREPSVAVEIESYRPFFILGEVAAPGQYPYVPNMSVESAVAIAGGFSPRAKRDQVTLTHTDSSGSTRYVVPLGTAISPGDTVLVGERWFLNHLTFRHSGAARSGELRFAIAPRRIHNHDREYGFRAHAKTRVPE